MSLRRMINEKCKDCIYDPASSGTWRQQVALCSVKSCTLYDVRPKPTSPIPESNLRWYGVDLTEYRALQASSKEANHAKL
jgi:hypothetical protein